MPLSQGTVAEEWDQCLGQIERMVTEGLRPVKLNIFADIPDYKSYKDIKKIIGVSVSSRLRYSVPAYCVTVHPPENPWSIAVEGLFVPGATNEIRTKYAGALPYVVVATGCGREIWAAGLGTDEYPDNTREAAAKAFDKMAEILFQEKMSFNNIVRQWNFIGNILEMREGYQNYQHFNEVRSEYYSRFRTCLGYPAATGVGMKLGGVLIDFNAVEADDSLKIQSVENPDQINAYEYGQQVLKGLVWKDRKAKNQPQFERALFLANRSVSTLYISGTASIVGQETIGTGDIEEQTRVTIRNISKLTDSGRKIRSGEKQGQAHGRFSVVRVYIKNREDFSLVRKICDENYSPAPAIYIEADICRDDLLTEIEAEYSINH